MAASLAIDSPPPLARVTRAASLARMAESEGKDAAKEGKLTIKFAWMSGGLLPEMTSFVVKKTTPFQKVIDAWCNKYNRKQKAYRFLFEGEIVNAEDT